LTTLEKHRVRGDLIETFKTLPDRERVKKEDFFQLRQREYDIRSHQYSHAVQRSLVNIWSHFFSQRKLKNWNILFLITLCLQLLLTTARIVQWRREGICRPGQTSVLPPPPPSGVFRNLKRYISGVHCQKFSNFSIFFTVNISKKKFHIQKVPRRRGSPLDTSLVPPIRLAIDILMVTRMAMVWTVNSTLRWVVYIIA